MNELETYFCPFYSECRLIDESCSKNDPNFDFSICKTFKILKEFKDKIDGKKDLEDITWELEIEFRHIESKFKLLAKREKEIHQDKNKRTFKQFTIY